VATISSPRRRRRDWLDRRATYEDFAEIVGVHTGRWIFGKKVVPPAVVIQRIDLHSQTVFVDL
jgi:hypothetical protein